MTQKTPNEKSTFNFERDKRHKTEVLEYNCTVIAPDYSDNESNKKDLTLVLVVLQ